MKKPILNKWQFTISFQRDFARMERGWRIFEFGIFNLKKMPEKGEILHKELYKGFIIRFAIWIPFESI